MPLKRKCSIVALNQNIATEMKAGRSREQAVAIAYQTLRQSCKDEGKPVPTKKTLETVNKQATVSIYAIKFDKKKFKTEDSVIKWLKENDLNTEKIIESSSSWKAEQMSSMEFKEQSFREIKDGEGIVVIIGKLLKGIVTKSKTKKTREYLEEALKRARKILSPADYAVVFQAARASAGGQVSAKNRRERLSVVEKLYFDDTNINNLSVTELEEIQKSLFIADERSKTLNIKSNKVCKLALDIKNELSNRNIDLDKEIDSYLSEVKKGFDRGSADGGVHAHGLDRKNLKTSSDGSHYHLWKMPGTGEILSSNEDGNHAHSISEDDKIQDDGKHSHSIYNDGKLLSTSLGGEHSHGLLVETTGFDGQHTHELNLPDGTRLTSMTSKEIAADITSNDSNIIYLPCASVIASALRILEEKEKERSSRELPNIDDAIDMVMDGEELTPPVYVGEVLDATEKSIVYGNGIVNYEAPNHINAMVGDLVDMRNDGELIGFSKSVVPDAIDYCHNKNIHWELIKKHTTIVPFAGSNKAKLLFISAAPNELEVARRQAIVGEDSIIFDKSYLAPLGVKKSDVALGFIMPVLPYGDIDQDKCKKWSNNFIECLKNYPDAKIVALGKMAREVLKSAGFDCWSLPHPSAIRRHGDSGEVKRKLKTICKSLDYRSSIVQNNTTSKASPSNGKSLVIAEAISEMRETGCAKVQISKSMDEKQIVYGVVLDPYEVDLQNEWVPPSEIESTAHGFLAKSRVIGFEHKERADAQIVESWVEMYPSHDDYLKATRNEAHKAFKRKFGNDVIHSGAWVAGVKLGDKEWQLFKKGELNAFSVGGFSFKTSIMLSAMPKVDFIELIEKPLS